MVAPISAASTSGASLQSQNISTFRAQLQQLSRDIASYSLDEKTTQSLQKTISALDSFSSSNSVQELTQASKGLLSALDTLCSDSDYIRSQLEEMSKTPGKNKKPSSHILDIQLAAAAHLKSLIPQSIQPISSSSSISDTLDALRRPAEQGHFGAVTGVSIALQDAESTSSFSKLTVGGSLLSTLGDMTTEELEELIKSIIKNGFRDINEIIGLLGMISDNGPGIDPELLDLLAEKIADYVSTQASMTADPLEFMALLDEISTFVSTDLGGDMFQSMDLSGLLTTMVSNVDPSKGDNSKTLNAMANALGIQNIAPEEQTDALTEDPVKPIDPTQDTQNQAIAAQLKSAELEVQKRLSPIDTTSNTDASQNNSPLLKVQSAMESYLNQNKTDFSLQILSMMEQYVEKNLNDHVDNVIDKLDIDQLGAFAKS